MNMKNKNVAAILAILLGSFGIHKFYLGQPGKGWGYLLLCWTGIPGVIGIIEGIILLCKSKEDFERSFSSGFNPDSDVKYSFTGINGKLLVFDNKIEISHSGVAGVLSNGFSGSKSIPYKAIQSVQLKEGGIALHGYIQFGIMGGKEKLGGVEKAFDDENSIVFPMAKNNIAKEIVSFIEDKIYNVGTAQTIVNNVSSADEILKLKQLLDSGIITQEEFDKKKSQLLK